MVPDATITDLPSHIRQATERGYRVDTDHDPGRWSLFNPYGDYRGSYDSADDAWRAAPRDRRTSPRG